MAIINLADSLEEATRLGSNPTQIDEKLYTYETYIGKCIKDTEHNGYDDSDFYMLVWNDEKNEPESIEFASTRYWSYPCMASYVDATPEVLAKYDEWLKLRNEQIQKENEEREKQNPTLGKEVLVIGGKKHKNKIGRVFWRDLNKFKFNNYAWQKRLFPAIKGSFENIPNEVVGIETKDGERFFVDADKVKVVLE